MNILYNRNIDDNTLKLFTFMDRFVYENLNNKLYYFKIVLHFTEISDYDNKLPYIGRFILNKDYLNPIIEVSQSAVEEISDYFIKIGDETYKSNAQYKYKVIFHELAHLTGVYNDEEMMNKFINSNKLVCDDSEEDRANEISDEFLKTNGIL